MEILLKWELEEVEKGRGRGTEKKTRWDGKMDEADKREGSEGERDKEERGGKM